MESHSTDAAGWAAWESSPHSGRNTVEALNRFLSAMVNETWDELDRTLKITERLPEFSGILPLGDPELRPYLNKAGVFFVLGPLPSLALLHIGASRGPIGFALRSRIEERSEGDFVWRWEKRSYPPPTFVAIATMEDYWAFVPPLRNLLARKLGEEASESGGTDSRTRPE